MLIAILRLVRLPNLLVVTLTQWLIAEQLLWQAFETNDITPVLSMAELGFLIFSTICVTALGYIVNDIFDYEIDLINKPDRIILGRLLSKQSASRLAYFFGIIGFCAALFLAWSKQEMEWIWLYPVFAGLLLAYPAGLKRHHITGNVFVALACAGTAGLVWLAERSSWRQLADPDQENVAQLITLFMVYAFIATWIREIVKDLEDQQGDQAVGRASLALHWGEGQAQNMVFGLGVFLIIALIGICWLPVFGDLNLLGQILIPILVFAILLLNWLLARAKTRKDYHRLSQLWKYFLLGGLSILLCY